MVQTAKDLLLESLTRWPDNPALCIGEKEISYQQFLDPVLELNESLAQTFSEQSALGVLADKSLLGYQCIASAFLADKTYVPLNNHYPLLRNAEIVAQSGVRVVLVDSGCRDLADELYAHLEGKVSLIILRTNGESKLGFDIVADRQSLTQQRNWQLPSDDTAYILFTSGSTGTPKGVPVSNQNLATYLRQIALHFDFRSDDRFSQFFDFTFDLSLHDMLVCWQCGACLCVPDKMAQLMPLQFAAKRQLTVWFSVPSLALTAKDLMRDSFSEFRLESLRLSFFCGEALPQTLAHTWSQIAQKSLVVNLYGPTEATIAFTAHQYREPEDAQYPVVPIGHALGSNKTAILDATGRACEHGELCLAGAQVFAGYWQAEDLNQNAFHNGGESDVPDGEKWYRTGDIVSELECGTLLYHGRIDRQVQVNGFRVELQEVEHALRKMVNAGTLAVIAYPHNSIGEPVGLTVFVNSNLDADELLERCKQHLPSYMIPKHLLSLEEFPYNASGKLDYKQLTQIATDAAVSV